MSKIEIGCKGIVIKSLCIENIGKLVTVLGFINYENPNEPKNAVMVNRFMTCVDGIPRRMTYEHNLQRIDDNPETLKLEEELVVNE